MKARRLGVCVVGVAIAVGAAYFVWPQYFASIASLASTDQAKGAPKKGEAKGRPPGAPVTAAVVVESDMPVILVAPGTVEPLANVTVKTRVDGQINEVRFKEGDFVKAGDVMFLLDDRLVKAQIAQAEASIAKDQASLRDAEATMARRMALIDKKIVTEASLDQSKFAVEGFKASIAAGQALLDSQKTQLDYLTIRAPISGRTGTINAKVGTMVRGTDSLALVTINQTKPIWVTFALPQSDLAAMRRALTTNSLADVTIPGGAKPTVVQATIAFVDNQVDKTTGTITAKVMAENADEVLWPGQSVLVALTVEVKRSVMSVPATAVLPSQQGMMTWVIGGDNKVTPRTVVIERIVGQTAFLAQGVKVGERVVTDGQIRLAPGTTVNVEEPRRPQAPSPASEERRMNGRG
jgi:membrane fusion protein, multidrug efflux system